MNSPVPDPCLIAILHDQPPSVFPNGIVRIEQREIGLLKIPTGRIVACDPFMMFDPAAFTERTPTGSFPVDLFIAHYQHGDQRIAAARLRFSHHPAEWWDLARLPDQDLSELEADHFFGYPVDSGTGSFMDFRAAKSLDERMASSDGYFQEIIREMDLTYVHTRSWAMLESDRDGELNAAVFSSGWGDGMYASFWGWSGEGLTCLVTDFGLLYSSPE
jgi:hypothetical protein